MMNRGDRLADGLPCPNVWTRDMTSLPGKSSAAAVVQIFAAYSFLPRHDKTEIKLISRFPWSPLSLRLPSVNIYIYTLHLTNINAHWKFWNNTKYTKNHKRTIFHKYVHWTVHQRRSKINGISRTNCAPTKRDPEEYPDAYASWPRPNKGMVPFPLSNPFV